MNSDFGVRHFYSIFLAIVCQLEHVVWYFCDFSSIFLFLKKIIPALTLTNGKGTWGKKDGSDEHMLIKLFTSAGVIDAVTSASCVY